MKTCPNCGKELKDEAKFCGGCGTKLETSALSSNPESAEKVDISVTASYIQWNILPGQLALKISEKDISSYGKVKGLVVQEGTKALFFVEGKLAAQLEAGKYAFKDYSKSVPENNEESKKSRLGNFFGNIVNYLKGGNKESVSGGHQICIVLVRSTEFPLVFNYKDVNTANIRSDIGLQLLCKVTNINSFYEHLLLDSSMVCYETVAKTLDSSVNAAVNSVLSSYSPDKISSAVSSLQTALQSQIVNYYPYFSVERIINLTAQREELEEIRKLQEELYVSELELIELTKRNNFLNRMQDENNAQTLREARSEVDFQSAMDKIDQDRELNDDERLKFSQMLEAQRMIREAKTQDEVEAAILVFRKSEMLREEEIENLQAQINQNSALRDLAYEQALNLATLANEKEIDRQNLQWEIEIGNARIENELARARMQDAYSDERRRAEMQLDKEEMQNQMELLRQAQAIREERENAEHQRQLETNAQKIAHEEEMRRMFQNMTAEQILASNPDITPEAANAMAEKFKAEAQANANDKNAEMAMKQSAEMQLFMQQQMQMMRDMAVAGMNANAMNQQQMMANKDAEMNRFTNGVNNAVSSVSGALKNPQTVVQNTGSDTKPVCPSCGTPHENGAIFCENCGNSL